LILRGNKQGVKIGEEIEKLQNLKLDFAKKASPETAKFVDSFSANGFYFFVENMVSLLTGELVDQTKLINLLKDVKRFEDDDEELFTFKETSLGTESSRSTRALLIWWMRSWASRNLHFPS
jgi:hypothetical protein